MPIQTVGLTTIMDDVGTALNNADILVEMPRITAIDPGFSILQRTEIIDGQGKTARPGPVNSHYLMFQISTHDLPHILEVVDRWDWPQCNVQA